MRRLSIVAVCVVALAAPLRAQPAKRDTVVLIAYHSVTGTTETLARAVEEGARSVAGTRVLLKRVGEVSADDLLGADAVIVGTPVYNGGVSSEVKQFIDRWPFGRLKDKVGAAFCAAGGASAGEEIALVSLIASMLIFQFVIVGGETWHAAFGASAITEEGRPPGARVVGETAKAHARGLGARVARVAGALVRAQG
jgi:NAD(P)H dehydrogenase (quinone)